MSYVKIHNLGHPQIRELFFDPVLVEEKVDGSQFSFGVLDGQLRFYSKNQEVYPESAGMFDEGVKAVSDLAGRLQQGWLYRGEYLRKPKHNALAYDRVPSRHVILFDVTVGPESFLSRRDKEGVADKLGLEIVPAVEVTQFDKEHLDTMLDRVSVLGGQKVEGLVFKNYTRFGRDGKPLFGKYVSPAFREIHGGAWKKANPGKADMIDMLIQAYRTPARWDKAIQHLRERGLLTDSPKDIGLLIKEAQEDLFKECGQEIADKLWDWAQGKIGRGVISGLSEYYKKKLMESQFGGTNESSSTEAPVASRESAGSGEEVGVAAQGPAVAADVGV